MNYDTWFRKHVDNLVELWRAYESDTGETIGFEMFTLGLYVETEHARKVES